MSAHCVLCLQSPPREAVGTRYGLPTCDHCGIVDPRDVAAEIQRMSMGNGSLTVEVGR